LEGGHHEAEGQTAQSEDIGQKSFKEIDENQNHENAEKDDIDPEGSLETVFDIKKVEQHPGEGLYQWIDPGNSGAALAALSPQQ
jgi:hypothetical protein